MGKKKISERTAAIDRGKKKLTERERKREMDR